jgi:serine/threonine protein kinase
MSTDPEPKPTEIVNGRFAIVGVLGAGAQGETLVAKDATSGKLVALKRFFVRGAASWKSVELAEREAIVQQGLVHPNLPRYVTHFEHEGALCLVTERIEGESLAQLLAQGRTLSQAEILRFLQDAASALAYLHALSPPVIHRDIKPANVLRRPDGSFAIVDFGSVQHRLRETGGSTVAGTFGFMAPEQLQGRAGPESDVYAAAATAVTALSGHQPEELPHRGLELDLAKALPTCDRNLRLALQAMLQPNPELRPKTIVAALEARRLSTSAGGAGLSRRKGWPRRLAGWSLLLVGLGAAAGAAVHFNGRRRAAPPPVATKLVTDWERAESAWQRGDIADAGRLFLAARKREPTHAITLREAEAVSIADPRAAPPVVLALKQAWYRGPTDSAQGVLDCLVDKLERDLPMREREPPLCVMAPMNQRQWSRSQSSHTNPAYALHDPAGYVRFWPIYEGSEGHAGWGTATKSLEPLVTANAAADSGVRRAIFAAMAGDSALLETELRQVDNLFVEFAKMRERRDAGIAETPDPTDTSPTPRSADEIVEERETARFDAERALSVAAAAAWFGHDDQRVVAYLPHAEAHSRGIFYQHLRRVSGQLLDDPHPAQSPGDYNVVDMQIFMSLRQEPPADTLKRMQGTGFSEPSRLFQMFAAGRHPQAQKLFAAWVRSGFVAATPAGGFYELFERAFRRREAARLIGDKKLEAELLTVTQKLGKVLRDPRRYAAIVSLESLLAKE